MPSRNITRFSLFFQFIFFLFYILLHYYKIPIVFNLVTFQLHLHMVYIYRNLFDMQELARHTVSF
jgi:hypothetical protein